jgi:hypothetical protein
MMQMRGAAEPHGNESTITYWKRRVGVARLRLLSEMVPASYEVRFDVNSP